MRIPWGTGAGVLAQAAPESRLIVWAGAVLTCAVVDPATGAGLLATLVTVAVMVGLARPPLGVMTRVVLLAAIMLGPVFLLTPWSTVTPPKDVMALIEPIVAPWRVFLRGLCVMVLTSQVVVVLTRSSFRDGLARLPVPSLIRAIVHQVLMQVDVQSEEMRRILIAMRARGATRGFRNRVRVGFGMPQVWLGRLLFRAERHARAMEARGYAGENFAFSSSGWRVRDTACLVGAVVWFAGALWLRWESGS